MFIHGYNHGHKITCFLFPISWDRIPVDMAPFSGTPGLRVEETMSEVGDGEWLGTVFWSGIIWKNQIIHMSLIESMYMVCGYITYIYIYLYIYIYI